MPRNTWGKAGARPQKPQSRKAAVAAEEFTAYVEEETASFIMPLTRQHKGKLPGYTVLYPVTVCHDFPSVQLSFDNGNQFYVGRLPKPEAPYETEVADQHNFNSGDMVILAYGRNYSLQRWHKVR